MGTVRFVVTSYYGREHGVDDELKAGLPQDTELTGWMNASFELVRSTGLTVEQAKEVHWRALVLNLTEMTRPEVTTMFDYEDKHSRRQEYDKVLEIRNSANPESIPPADESTVKYDNITSLNAKDFPNWFATSTGHVGRSYAVPEPGFVVAVFYGASTAFLLRPVPDHDTFEFVGEAYAHGVMQGEALLDSNQGIYPKQVFKLV